MPLHFSLLLCVARIAEEMHSNTSSPQARASSRLRFSSRRNFILAQLKREEQRYSECIFGTFSFPFLDVWLDL